MTRLAAGAAGASAAGGAAASTTAGAVVLTIRGGAEAAGALDASAFALAGATAFTGLGAGGGGASSTTGSRRIPRLSARRRTRSAEGSSIEDEWLLTPTRNSSHSSSTAWFSTPSSRASSYTRIFFVAKTVSLRRRGPGSYFASKSANSVARTASNVCVGTDPRNACAHRCFVVARSKQVGEHAQAPRPGAVRPPEQAPLVSRATRTIPADGWRRRQPRQVRTGTVIRLLAPRLRAPRQFRPALPQQHLPAFRPRRRWCPRRIPLRQRRSSCHRRA